MTSEIDKQLRSAKKANELFDRMRIRELKDIIGNLSVCLERAEKGEHFSVDLYASQLVKIAEAEKRYEVTQVTVNVLKGIKAETESVMEEMDE